MTRNKVLFAAVLLPVASNVGIDGRGKSPKEIWAEYQSQGHKFVDQFDMEFQRLMRYHYPTYTR